MERSDAERVIHAIRLRGGWNVSSDGGRTYHTRKFGRPRTLDSDERLWLCCPALPVPAEVVVNGVLVAAVTHAEAFAVDITHLLRDRNAVQFAVTSAQSLGELTIEICQALN